VAGTVDILVLCGKRLAT